MTHPSASTAAGDPASSCKQRLRDEAAHRAGSRSAGRRTQGDADHRDLRQGRHRQEFHARQPLLHDGAAGQEGAADRLRSEERYHLAAVRRPRLPDDHRNLARRRSSPAKQVAIGDVCFKRDGVFAMELGGPEVGRGCGGRGIIHGFETAREARLPRLGLRLRAARLPRRRGLRRLRPADRPRHVPEGHRRRLQRPAVALRRQQRLLGGRVLPQARRQRRRRRHGRSTRTTAPARRRLLPKPSAFRCWPRSRPTTTSAARAPTTRSSVAPAASGAPLFEELASNVAEAPPVQPTPLSQDGLLGLFAGEAVGRDVVLAAGDARGHVRRHRSSRSRRSRSSTTTSERQRMTACSD